MAPIKLYVLIGASIAFERVALPVLAFACPGDTTVSFEATREAVGRMPHGELQVVNDCEPQSTHVLTGDIAVDVHYLGLW